MGKKYLVLNYWIFKVKEEEGGLWRRNGFEIFEHRTRECFWGIREYNEKGRLEARVGELQKGDYVVFYLVGKNGSRFLGTCVLDSGFERLNPDRAKKIIHREYLDLEEGVSLKEVDKWAKPLSIECLRGKDSFVAKGGKFGSYFQGSIKRIRTKEEYDTIIREHELMV
jgi:predicted RNA-binding protein with PUA-like domain